MKLGVCVPYRNREAHLKEFIPKIGKYLDGQGIDYCIYFGHQVDDKLFNRGAMKNIAAKHAFEEGCDYIVWHDIDMIPEDSSCDYSFPDNLPQLPTDFADTRRQVTQSVFDRQLGLLQPEFTRQRYHRIDVIPRSPWTPRL